MLHRHLNKLKESGSQTIESSNEICAVAEEVIGTHFPFRGWKLVHIRSTARILDSKFIKGRF
jgi:hypothetical protein